MLTVRNIITTFIIALLIGFAYYTWAPASWKPAWLGGTPAAAVSPAAGPSARDFRGYAGLLELKRLDDDDRIQVLWASFGTMPGSHGLDASDVRTPLTGSNQVRFPVQVGQAIYFAVINSTAIDGLIIDEPETYHVTWVRQAPQGVRYDPGTINVGDGGEIPTDG